MRILFEMDFKDYKPNGRAFIRPSVRAIIIKDHKIAMVYSQKYDYYKFPGGGIEKGESQIDTLIREVREEAGFNVIKDSIKEYGLVTRRQKAERIDKFDIFVQDNYYYLCNVEEERVEQKLDNYEKEEGFILKWMYPIDVIYVNRNHNHENKDQYMLEREAKVLEKLAQEKYFN